MPSLGQVLPAFLLCSTLLVIKMYVVGVITGYTRLRKKAFANPEDALRHEGLQFCRSDPDVERCLRAHRSDMETDYPFLFLGFIYSFLRPEPLIAWIHFLVVLTGRVVHTIAYLGKLNPRIRSGAYVLAQFAQCLHGPADPSALVRTGSGMVCAHSKLCLPGQGLSFSKRPSVRDGLCLTNQRRGFGLLQHL